MIWVPASGTLIKKLKFAITSAEELQNSCRNVPEVVAVKIFVSTMVSTTRKTRPIMGFEGIFELTTTQDFWIL